MKPVLLLGIGNSLRRDDGAGPALAERLLWHPKIEALPVHQLCPEHIEMFHHRELLIFADAAVDCSRVEVRVVPVCSDSIPSTIGHHQQPAGLVALYQALYQAAPSAELLSIPGLDFDYGEGISQHTQSAIDDAVRLLENRFRS
jgi:hydrogenase maturation protease